MVDHRDRAWDRRACRPQKVCPGIPSPFLHRSAATILRLMITVPALSFNVRCLLVAVWQLVRLCAQVLLGSDAAEGRAGGAAIGSREPAGCVGEPFPQQEEAPPSVQPSLPHPVGGALEVPGWLGRPRPPHEAGYGCQTPMAVVPRNSIRARLGDFAHSGVSAILRLMTTVSALPDWRLNGGS